MKFVAVLLGACLLVIGLMAYALIPNVHTVPVQSSSTLPVPPPVVVYPNSQYETHQNITIESGKTNEAFFNLTVSIGSGSPSTIEFKVSTYAQEVNCMRDVNPHGCLVDQTVSNQTIAVPLNTTGTYYYALNNKESISPKTVAISSSLVTRSVNSFVTRDGQSNFAALGLGVIGLFVAAYGLVAKTVIPWD
ncbi:MAG TPA: hypothetical protein VE955_05490 [Candidatus Dormibacteraeota bacterium]|nr:hypothetical protein [Candidatus Dormibacteraeota bacterium]